MNIFILNTGRCGSTTFIKACQHMTNYTSSHESRATCIGEARLAYPQQHIEADNRLAWILGRLDETYADNAFYVHLKRNKANTIESFKKRHQYGIMKAYKEGILLGGSDNQTTEAIASDYIATIESNINFFLKNKTKTMSFSLENAERDYKTFWNAISAEGDYTAALAEWSINYNKS